MKTLKWNVLSLFFLMVGGIAAFGQQNRMEVPGDNFSLEGALQLFRQSGSPEEFERLLNSSNSKVNNLDLNGDGHIDYIRVINRQEGNVHVFILQAIVTASESQDVAVISLEKLANGKAVLQITGDEDVYGIETIIEPTEEVRVMAGTTTARNVVNVWTWPAVQYVYSPYYTVWVSPWTWYRRPVWWRTWRPVAYYDYYGWWEPYRPYYARCYAPRIVYAHHIYRPYRATSVVVYNRHYTEINHYRTVYRDEYRQSRSYYADDRSRRNNYTDARNTRNNYADDRNRRSDYIVDRNRQDYSSGNRAGGSRDSYSGDRTGRNQFENRSTDRQYTRDNSAVRVPDARQRLTQGDQVNSRTSATTSNQRQDQVQMNRNSTISRENATSSRADFQSKPNVPNRNYAVPGNDGSSGRFRSADVRVNSPQGQKQPAPKVESSRSSETPVINRSNERGPAKRFER